MREGHRLPALHEAQERLETRNILDAGLGPRLGIATRDWGDGLWSVRCATAPDHQPGNQITGIGPETLELADRFVGRGFRVVMPHLFGPLGKLAEEEGDDSSDEDASTEVCMRALLHVSWLPLQGRTLSITWPRGAFADGRALPTTTPSGG